MDLARPRSDTAARIPVAPSVVPVCWVRPFRFAGVNVAVEPAWESLFADAEIDHANVVVAQLTSCLSFVVVGAAESASTALPDVASMCDAVA